MAVVYPELQRNPNLIRIPCDKNTLVYPVSYNVYPVIRNRNSILSSCWESPIRPREIGLGLGVQRVCLKTGQPTNWAVSLCCPTKKHPKTGYPQKDEPPMLDADPAGLAGGAKREWLLSEMRRQRQSGSDHFWGYGCVSKKLGHKSIGVPLVVHSDKPKHGVVKKTHLDLF